MLTKDEYNKQYKIGDKKELLELDKKGFISLTGLTTAIDIVLNNLALKAEYDFSYQGYVNDWEEAQSW